MVECQGADDKNCREYLMTLIRERPTIKGIIGLITIPLGVLGVIVLLLSLLYGKSVEMNAMSVRTLSEVVSANKDLNTRQDERIRAVELNQVAFTEQVKSIAESMGLIKASIARIENSKRTSRDIQ